LLVLESDLWLVPWSLFCHPPQEFVISAAWIFSQSFVMVLCLSTCSCTSLMIRLLCYETSEMLAWISSWVRPSCRLSAVVAENTSLELVLRRQWWKIWPVQHHLILLNSPLIHTSWGIVGSSGNHCILVEILVWTLKAIVQFAGLWIVATQDPRIVKFHYPQRYFLSGFLCTDQSPSVVSLAIANCSLVLAFLWFLFVLPEFVLLLDWVFLAFQRPFFFLAVGSQIFLFFLQLLYFLLNSF
jgi:hypothetical protein